MEITKQGNKFFPNYRKIVVSISKVVTPNGYEYEVAGNLTKMKNKDLLSVKLGDEWFIVSLHAIRGMLYSSKSRSTSIFRTSKSVDDTKEVKDDADTTKVVLPDYKRKV